VQGPHGGLRLAQRPVHSHYRMLRHDEPPSDWKSLKRGAATPSTLPTPLSRKVNIVAPLCAGPGPRSCLPAVPPRSASPRRGPPPGRSPSRTAPRRSASVRVARRRTASVRSARRRSTPCRSAPARSAPHSSAPMNCLSPAARSS
jgi:hypothetical protein